VCSLVRVTVISSETSVCSTIIELCRSHLFIWFEWFFVEILWSYLRQLRNKLIGKCNCLVIIMTILFRLQSIGRRWKDILIVSFEIGLTSDWPRSSCSRRYVDCSRKKEVSIVYIILSFRKLRRSMKAYSFSFSWSYDES